MSGFKEKAAIGLGVGLGITAITGACYWYRQKVRNAYPKSWRRVGTLTKLAFTPIKSCQTVFLTEGNCKTTGLENEHCRDHMFMLIDDTNKVVTGRGYPHMLKITQITTSKGVIVSAPGMDPLEIEYTSVTEGGTVKVNLFGSDVYVAECNEKYGNWFSKFILKEDKGLRLAYYPYMTPTKVVKDKLANGVFLNDDTGSLQDVSSYMLINNTSVDDFNTRLKKPVDPMQFRPNFLVNTDGPAYDEDNWNWIKIGNDAVFRTVAPCYRCIFTNIAPDTAERDPEGEPLKVLKSYRYVPKAKSPVMGVQLGLRTPGVVKVGDEIYVGA